MRPLFALILCLLLSCIISAQEENPTPYEIALQRIEEARINNSDDLDLSHLGLTQLPSDIGNLTELRVLVLAGNNLTELPNEIGQLTNLLYLDLENNNLQGFPSSVGNLSNLGRLNAGNNQISSLPAEFRNLQSLTELFLWSNELDEFPLTITELPQMYILGLGDNHISHIPPEIAHLQHLCWLDISHNKISVLPSELIELDGLLSSACTSNSYTDGLFYFDSGELRVNNNPLVSPPPAVIAQGTAAVLDYLRNQAWWHVQRLILGGVSAVGIVSIAILGLRWRNNRSKSKKKNQEAIRENQ